MKLVLWYHILADFTLEKSEKDEKWCISFNKTYSLAFKGNSTSFEVSENTSLRSFLCRSTIMKTSFLIVDFPIIL